MKKKNQKKKLIYKNNKQNKSTMLGTNLICDTFLTLISFK